MKRFLPYIPTIGIVTVSFLGGSLLSMANFAATPTPDPNITKANFEYLTVDNEDDIGYFELEGGLPGSERVMTHNELSGAIQEDGGEVLLPAIGSYILSQSAGIHATGTVGVRGQNNLRDGHYGRFAIEAETYDADENALSYVGYLEYDDSTPGTTAETLDVSLVSSEAPGHQYVPISQGIPWAFYTDAASKFNDVEIEGTIVSDPDGIEIEGDPTVYDGIVIDDDLSIRGTTILGFDNKLYGVDDYVSTEPLWNSSGVQQVFMVSNSASYSAGSAAEAKAQSVTCPTGTIRLSCSARLHSSKPAASSPLKGVKKKESRECRAYAQKPAGQELQFYVYAYCMKPNPLFP